jgi:hypothetical protein
VNGQPAPANYVAVINRDLLPLLAATLDILLAERLGPIYNVESIEVHGNTLEFSLGAN